MSERARPSVGADLGVDVPGTALTPSEKPAQPTPVRWSRTLFVAPFVFLLFLSISVGLLINVWSSPLTHIDGTQDALQSVWFMSWPPFALTHHHSPFTGTYMNYPPGINLLWNTSAIGPAILLWPVTAIWNAVLTYNVIMTASMALAGAFAFIAIRRYVPGVLAALPAAAIYAFSPYMMAHMTGHLHSVVSAVTAPLLLLLLDELLLRQRMRTWVLGILLAVLEVFQFFSHEENFVTEIMVALLLALVLALVFRSQVRERWPYIARTLAVTVPLGAVVLAYPVYVQLFGPGRVLGTIHDPDVYSTDLLNLLVPDYLQFFAPPGAQTMSNRFTGNASEWNAYLGFPLVLIALITIVRYWQVAVVRVSALVAALVTLLSLGPHLHVAGQITSIPLPWWVVARIPLIRDVLPARLGVYIYLAVGVVLAFALSRLFAARAGPLLASGAAALALIPLVPSFPLRSVAVSAPEFFTSSSVQAIPQGSVMLAIPWTSPDSLQQMNALVWAAESHMRFRVIGGYFLNPPAAGQEGLHAFVDSLASSEPPPQLDAAGRDHILSLLRQNDVGVVVLGPVLQHAAARDLLTGLLGAQPRDVDGNDMWLLPASPPPP